MSFIEFERRQVGTDYAMTELQSHEYYEIYCLTKGTRKLFIGNGTLHLDAPALCVIPPYTLHKTEGGPYERINLYLSADIIHPQDAQMLDCFGAISLLQRDKQHLAIRDLLYSASDLNSSVRQRHKQDLACAVVALLINLNCNERLNPIVTEKDGESTALEITKYIESCFGEQINLDILSTKFTISKNKLCKIVREMVGCSPMEYCSRVRINKAKSLLRSTKQSIESISEACGYSSANYFSLIFKKTIGISPREYRKKG